MEGLALVLGEVGIVGALEGPPQPALRRLEAFSLRPFKDLAKIHRSIRGQPIATVEELQRYAYEVPEDRDPPDVFTRFTAGEDVDPGELYRALDTEGRSAAGDSDAALEIVETLKRRLAHAFPDEIG